MATYRVGGVSLLTQLWRRLAVGTFIRLFHLLDRRPALMRAVTTLLRVRPVWPLGRTVLVTRDRQVADVLRRDGDFSLPDERAARFPTGAFILGMSRSPQFERERAELEHVVPHADGRRIRNLAWAASQRAVGLRADKGELDVVTDLSHPVGLAILTRYFGISADGHLRDDLRLLGALVASADSARDGFQRDAEAAAVRVVGRIEDEITATDRGLSGRPLPADPTVLQRLVYRWQHGHGPLDRDGVRRNMSGVLLPGTALVTRAFATSLVQILTRRRLRRIAVAAAQNTEWPVLDAVLLEAMRFHTVFPVIPRYCAHDTALAGFRRTYRIRAGRYVYAAASSAMFDPDSPLFAPGAEDDPSDTRLRGRQHYRHFGGGIHECLGQHVALGQMAPMLAAVLRLPEIALSSRISYSRDGITPEHLRVRYARHHAETTPDAAKPDEVVTLGS